MFSPSGSPGPTTIGLGTDLKDVNPAHLAFDRNSRDTHGGDDVLAQALPALEQAAGVEVQGRVAASPNAFGIVANLPTELQRDHPRDASETRIAPAHLGLPKRLAHLGYR